MRHAPGARFGHFILGEPLGEGGMGEVYRARDSRLERDVALKVLNARRVGDPAARRRWMTEARSAAALTHPNIVVVHDVGQVDGDVFIAMELVEGPCLRDVLARGALAAERVWALAEDLGAALASAHARGIVHRDIKPENILLTLDGRAKVLDFGIAKVVDDPEDVRDIAEASTIAQSTAPGLVIGTPIYMSPEQACGDAVDARSDIFSLGVLLYEAVTGAVPFVGERRVDLVASILKDEPPPLSEVGVPEELAAIVMRCLAKRPADRFADGRALLDALREGQVTRPPPSVQALAVERGPRRRWWAPVAALGLAACSLLVGLRFHEAGTREPLAPLAAPTTPRPAAVQSDLVEQALAARRAGATNVRSLLRKAIERDPDDASARLHLALAFVEWPDNGRDAYGEAVARRDGLSREDAATLHALEPLFLTDPPDRRTALGRLDALLAQRPNDAQRLFARARIRLHVDPQAALDDFTALLAVAPDFHAAMALRGELLLLHDRQEEGRREIDRCIAGSPNNTNCLRQRIRLNRDAGRCDEMVRDARRWRALDPTSSSARMFLAEGLAASEGYSAAVEELARQFGENVPLVGRPGMPEQMVARVLAGRGRFDEAQRLVEASTEKRRAIDVVWPHELAVRFEVRALDESGRRGDAAAAAERYFSQRSLWPAEGRNDDLGIGHDPSGLLLAAMADGGRLAESELHSRLRETVTEWHGRATERSRRYIAPYVVALAATTPERAEALHDASFDADALPRLFPGNPGHAYLGQHLLAAGRTERALPHLEQATRACYQVMFPVVSTRAWLHLGQTRQQLGDTEGACAAFRVVLDRWGSAQPRSRSADAARIAARTLSCGL